MKINKFGEMIFDQHDLCDLIMRGHDVTKMPKVTVSPDVDIQSLIQTVQNPDGLLLWTFPEGSDTAVPDYDHACQSRWAMPQLYQELDIAQHVLSLCRTQEQLQRAGQELIMYQERGLFDLLRYLKYLVDVMRENRIIWGVGRGSSVASYVLYLLGVHRVDSLHYDLDPHEFLR